MLSSAKSLLFEEPKGLLFISTRKYQIIFNSFQANVPILYPLNVFRGYKMGTLAWNGLIITIHHFV